MRKIALGVEVPASMLDEVATLIDCHFVIATELLTSKKYYNWFKDYSTISSAFRKPVILDNGAYEAETVDCQTLHRLAMEIKADLVFAPDVLHDGPKSLELTKTFLLNQFVTDVPYDIGIIPQGQTAGEIIDNYYKLRTDYHSRYQMVGLSFRNPRDTVMPHVSEPIHCLGLNTLAEIKHWPNNVVSMDTVKPIKAAAQNERIEEYTRGQGIWNAGMYIENKQLVYRNIARLHAELTL